MRNIVFQLLFFYAVIRVVTRVLKNAEQRNAPTKQAKLRIIGGVLNRLLVITMMSSVLLGIAFWLTGSI